MMTYKETLKILVKAATEFLDAPAGVDYPRCASDLKDNELHSEACKKLEDALALANLRLRD